MIAKISLSINVFDVSRRLFSHSSRQKKFVSCMINCESTILNKCTFYWNIFDELNIRHPLTTVTSFSNSIYYKTVPVLYFLFSLFLYFLSYLPRFTLLDFPTKSSKASLPFLSCHRPTSWLLQVLERVFQLTADFNSNYICNIFKVMCIYMFEIIHYDIL